MLFLLFLILWLLFLLFMLLLLLSLLIPQPYLWNVIKIGSGTAEILMSLSLSGGWVVVVSGWWLWWCKVIFMSNPTFELSWGWVGVVTKNISEENPICIAKIKFSTARAIQSEQKHPSRNVIPVGLQMPWPEWYATWYYDTWATGLDFVWTNLLKMHCHWTLDKMHTWYEGIQLIMINQSWWHQLPKAVCILWWPNIHRITNMK